MADESQENLEGDSICELCHFILFFKRKDQDIRSKEQKVEVTHTIFWQMQPQSWIKPHSIQKVVQPQSKTNFETIQPQLEYDSICAHVSILKIDGNHEMSTYTYNTINEQGMESGFLYKHIKMTFLYSFEFHCLATVVTNFNYEWAIN